MAFIKSVEDKVKNKVQKFQDLETKLVVLENQLSQNKQFKEFIKLQKEVDKQAKAVWSEVADLMISAGKKTIETDWVKLTIVDAKNLEIDEKTLPKKFKVTVPDKKAINAYIKEHEVLPPGVKQTDAPYLRKSFRDFVS